MSEPKNHVRKEGLTAAQFERLLQRLDSNRDSAGKKYEDLRRMLIRFFDWNSFPLAEDLADETFNRVARRLEDQEILDVVAFAWGVAKNIRHEARNKTLRLVSVADLPGEGSSLVEEQSAREIHGKIEREQLLKCLRLCMQRLSLEDRELFQAYHAVNEDHAKARHQLAVSLGLTIGALRMQVIRLREKLEKCTVRCATTPGRISVYVVNKPKMPC